MSDSIQPTDLTVDSQGRIGAEFSGHVKASGIELPEAQAVPGTPNFVQWNDPTGTLQEGISGSAQAGTRYLQLRSGVGDPEPVSLFLSSPVGAGVAQLFTFVGDESAVVLNGIGQSSFPRFWTNGGSFPGDFRFSMGTFLMSYGAFENESFEVEIHHTMDKVPRFVGICQFSDEGSRQVTYKVLGRDEETFEVIGIANAAFPSFVTFEYGWFAIA